VTLVCRVASDRPPGGAHARGCFFFLGGFLSSQPLAPAAAHEGGAVFFAEGDDVGCGDFRLLDCQAAVGAVGLEGAVDDYAGAGGGVDDRGAVERGEVATLGHGIAMRVELLVGQLARWRGRLGRRRAGGADELTQSIERGHNVSD
jgi:hypothetical protein